MKPASTSQLVQLMLELQRRQDTGVLSVDGEGVRTRLYFFQGRAVYADGGALGETLGRLLVATSVISQAQYAEAIALMSKRIAANSTQRMGEVLVELGHVSVQDVQDALIQQMRLRIAHLLQFERVSWSYDQDHDAVAQMPAYPMRVEPQVLQGIRLFVDRQRMRAYLASYLDGFVMLRAPLELIVRCFGLNDTRARLIASLGEDVILEQWLDAQGVDDAWWLMTALALTGVLASSGTKPSLAVRSQTQAENPSLAPPGSTGTFDVAQVRDGAALKPPGVPQPGALDPGAKRRLARVEAEQLLQHGLEYLEERDWPAAAAEFGAAVRAMPGAKEYQLYRAWALSRDAGTMDDETAAELEELALLTAKQDSRHPFPSYVLGHVALVRGDNDTALRYFRATQHRDPKNKDAANLVTRLSRKK